MERIQGSIERERVAHREYSAMDKVMNEGMYLAEKKKVESREEFTHRRGKKTKGWWQRKVCQTANERERVNRFPTARGKQLRNRERGRNLNLCMCSGLMPQPIDRLCSHYIDSEQSAKEERRGVGSPERCLLTWLCPTLSHSAHLSGGNAALSDPLTLWTADWEDSVQTQPLCGPTWRPRQWKDYCKTGAYCSYSDPILFSINVFQVRTRIISDSCIVSTF